MNKIKQYLTDAGGTAAFHALGDLTLGIEEGEIVVITTTNRMTLANPFGLVYTKWEPTEELINHVINQIDRSCQR